jgi:hypothetical protein
MDPVIRVCHHVFHSLQWLVTPDFVIRFSACYNNVLTNVELSDVLCINSNLIFTPAVLTLYHHSLKYCGNYKLLTWCEITAKLRGDLLLEQRTSLSHDVFLAEIQRTLY